jgi:hypothetical protein
MTDATIVAKPWNGRSAKMCFWFGLVGAAVAAIGAYGSGFGLWPFTLGLLAVVLGTVLCLISVIAGLIAFFRNRSGGGQGSRILAGLVLALGLLAIVAPWIAKGGKVPAIHDVTTNIVSPPQFTKISPRADNLAGVGTEDKWRELHASTYSDIVPLNMAKTPAEAIGTALRLVKERGWDVALSAPDRIEATATASPFQFKDDVVIVASVSRVGISDLGVNADRVRALIADLKAADRTTP